MNKFVNSYKSEMTWHQHLTVLHKEKL